jgi:DNA polymerase III alpha subunit
VTDYVELQVLTHFSLLRGASSPEELFGAAATHGYPAIGIGDIGTVAGVVRAWEAQKATGVRSIAGALIDLACGRRLILYPTDRPAWSRLTRLLTVGKRRAGKGKCELHWHDLAPWSEGMIAILLPHEADADNKAALADLKALYGRTGYMALFQRRRPGDAVRIDALARQASAAGVRAVVTGDVLYHAPEARLLQDVVTAVREKCTVDELGYPREFAERTFRQLEGFGSYGFPESHAASFAKIAYASAWMKHHHPDVFCAALMNAQPMGFYAPAQIVRDAREHGVEVRPPCVNASRWDCTLQRTGKRYLAVRLGLRQVRGLSNADGAKIVGARSITPFESVEDVWRRSGVQRAAIEKLADADAFYAFGADRRQGLWKVRGLGEAPLPLFAAADRAAETFSAEGIEPAVSLRPLTDGREVIEDYRSLQLSLRAHPLTFLREDLTRRGVTRCSDLLTIRDGRHVEVAGIILVRQKPGSAKGVLFITIEDESGIANGILWPDRFEAQRRTVMSASMIGMKGQVQKEGEVIHVICSKIIDYGTLLHRVGEMSFPHQTGRGDGARHAGSPDRGDKGWSPRQSNSYWPPHANGVDLEEVVRFKSHDFR